MRVNLLFVWDRILVALGVNLQEPQDLNSFPLACHCEGRPTQFVRLFGQRSIAQKQFRRVYLVLNNRFDQRSIAKLSRGVHIGSCLKECKYLLRIPSCCRDMQRTLPEAVHLICIFQIDSNKCRWIFKQITLQDLCRRKRTRMIRCGHASLTPYPPAAPEPSGGR